MYKRLAHSTLMSMTKEEIIKYLRIAEYNHQVCLEQIDQQYKNCMKLLKKERADVINNFVVNAITEFQNLIKNTAIRHWEI